MSSTAPIIPASLRRGEYATLILGSGLSTIGIIMRIYTKARLTKSMKPEDWFSLFGYLSFLAWLGLAIVIGGNGGDPIYKAYLSQVESTMYCPIVVLVKVSVLLQYITIFVVNRGNTFHYIIHVVLWTNVVFYTIVFFLVIFQCSPRAKEWDESLSGHCTSEHQLSVSTAVINVVSDFIILVLPFHRIWALQMPWKKKSKILAVFAVGLLACLSSVVRLVYSVQLSQISDTDAASQAQQLATDKDGLWGFAEIALGIIAGCMPIVPRFFKQPFFASLSSGSWSGFKRRQSSGNSSRTLGPRRFAKRSGGKTPIDTNSTKISKSTKESGSKSFQGIETQNLTRASIDLPVTTFLKSPSPVYRMDSLSPLVDTSTSDPPVTSRDRDLEWQEMNRIEKAESSKETKRDELER